MESLILNQTSPDFQINLLVFIAGIALHVVKSAIENKVSIKDYYIQYKARTAFSFGSLISAFSYVQISHPGAPLLMYFIGGILIESYANRCPVSADRAFEILEFNAGKGTLNTETKK